MNASGLDSSEDRSSIDTGYPGGLVSCHHQDLAATLFAPTKNRWRVEPDRQPFSRLESNDCCFFLAPHLSVEKAFNRLDPFC